MALGSKVAFQSRAVELGELGVSQVNVDALEAKGITSYATYAYCCTFQPGQVDDSALKDVLKDAAPDAASLSRYRRLFFEAHALSLEDLKPRVDRSEASEARVIPLPEKLDRVRLQKDRLVGISFTPTVEPSHSLIDRACQQLEDNVVSYIELRKCSSRHDETLHAKTDTTLTLDPSGGLRLTKRQKLDNINLTGEHRLRQAFVRRSLAYDLANIGSFAVLDKWTQKLFERMNEPPLANYKFVSVEQILNADKSLWVKVSDSTRGRLNVATGPRKVFDVEFEKFCDHPEVLQHLMPLQQSSSAKGSGHHDDLPTDRFRHGGDKGDKGKGKGKGKAKGLGIPVPDDCEIFVDITQLSKKWQVGRCSAMVKAGKRCMIGWHLCWKKNCHRAHPGNECPGN